LETHRHRIVNYDYYQSEGICSIGSGAIESTIKQIDRRLKISGAQWLEQNVSQVLKHRCVTRSLSEGVLKDTPADIPFRESFRAYLNDQL
jgi:hypothetical protein